MKKTVFIKNAAILTVSSLLLRFIGIIFRVWLAAKIGSEGIGLYQLVFSVYMFVATFATSGICTAVTRLVSEELVTGSKHGIRCILIKCIQISCIIAVITIFLLYFGADFISAKLLRDSRTSLSLKILGFSLPFMGICSCFKGYFIARRKAAPSSGAQMLEQVIRIVIIIPLITQFDNAGLKYACACVLIGDTIAEAASCLYIFIRYHIDFKKLPAFSTASHKTGSLLAKISHIALPITSGKYLNSLLRTIENVLVPICLTNSVLGGNGISLFGMIKGMALPVLFFPSTLLGALSTLLLPEISEAKACGRAAILQSIVSQIIKITSIISIIFSAVFLVCGQQIGELIYKNQDVGFLLCALSPIIPFMYLDAISDGILKGLDQQKFTFFTSVGDSSARIILILLLLKEFGIYGFIGIMYFSNFATGFLNTKRLLKICKIKPNLMQNAFLPVCSGFSICLFVKFILSSFNISNFIYVILICIVCVPLYLYLMYLLNVITVDDISFIKRK